MQVQRRQVCSLRPGPGLTGGAPRLCAIAWILAALGVISGCARSPEPGREPVVGVSNSLLSAAVTDLLGDEVAIVQLAEPGTCPGHFDVRPSQVERLRTCKLLLRFDFQDGLDGPLVSLQRRGLRIVAVGVERGLCVPTTYADICRQVADALIGAGLQERAEADRRLAAIGERLEQLTGEVRERMTANKLVGRSVIASGHQADFCRFLGLQVAAVFSGPERMPVSEIDAALRAADGAWLVIANEPEGTQMADTLAERLRVPLVVLANFPGAEHGGRFDELVRGNVRALLAAAAP